MALKPGCEKLEVVVANHVERKKDFKMYRLLTAVFAMCAGSFPCSATTVLVLLTHDAVLIGADGMRVDVSASNKRHGQICKVRNVGDCYYAAAGIASIQHLNFNIYASAQLACRQPGTLADKAASFQRAVYPSLTKIFAQKSRFPIIKQQNVAVVFAGIEAGEPTIAVTNFWQDGTGVLQQRRGLLRGRDASAQPTLLTLGIVEAIQRNKLSHPQQFAAGYEFVEIERLLQTEIQNDQKKLFDEQLVGPPIVLLKISKKGAQWIRSGACPASNTSRP